MRAAGAGLTYRETLGQVDALERKEAYEVVGRNTVFRVVPPALHFAGCAPGQTMTRTVRVVNVSPVAQRLSVLTLRSRTFRLKYDLLGNIAPGMAQEIVVEFRPDDWRYYNENVLVRCMDENLVIPLHAYPVLGKLRVPSRIAFTTNRLASPVERVLVIPNDTPVEFEFRVESVKPHPCISVEPAEGVVHAVSDTEIRFTFTPVDYTLADACFRVFVSQFGYAPRTVVVTGVARQGGSEPALVELDEPQADDQADESELMENALLGAASTANKLRTRRSSTGRTQRAARQPASGASASTATGGTPREVAIDGYRVPSNVFTQAGMSRFMMQERGKLPLRQLQRALQHSESRDAQAGAESDAPDRDAVMWGRSAQQKAALFGQALSAAATEVGNRSLKLGPVVGRDLMPEADEEAVRAARGERARRETEDKLVRATQRTEHVVEKTPVVAAVPRELAPLATELTDYQVSDMLGVRLQTLARFRAAASRVIYRLRGARRLAKIKYFLENGKFVDEVKSNASSSTPGDAVDVDALRQCSIAVLPVAAEDDAAAFATPLADAVEFVPVEGKLYSLRAAKQSELLAYVDQPSDVKADASYGPGKQPAPLPPATEYPVHLHLLDNLAR